MTQFIECAITCGGQNMYQIPQIHIFRIKNDGALRFLGLKSIHLLPTTVMST